MKKAFPEAGEVWELDVKNGYDIRRYLLLRLEQKEKCYLALDLRNSNVVELALQYGEFWHCWRRVA
jgi:hypothetical protein